MQPSTREKPQAAGYRVWLPIQQQYLTRYPAWVFGLQQVSPAGGESKSRSCQRRSHANADQE